MAITRLKAGEHSGVGHFSSSAPILEGEGWIERDSLLIYTGLHESMEGPVDVNEGHIDLLVANHNARLDKFRKGAAEVPLKACPPLQLDHSTSAAVTVGRVTGQLRKEQFLDEETGSLCFGAFGPVRVLGRENVEKVKDGRWIHQSIGADLDVGKLNELSIVPFPAALSASFLSARQARLATNNSAKAEGAKKMTFIERLKAKFKFSQPEQATEREQKLRAYLAAEKGMTDDDACKHMAEMDDESMSKLSGDMDAHDQKLAAAAAEEAAKLSGATGDENTVTTEKKDANLAADPDPKEETEEEKTAKLAAAASANGIKLQAAAPASSSQFSAEEKASFVKMAAGFKATAAGAQLAAKQAQLSARISGLRMSAKITPAEIKKIDLVKLSGENEATIQAIFKSYEDREPVILAGVIGSSKARTVGELTSEIRMSEIEMRARQNMPFTGGAGKRAKMAAGKVGKKLSSEGLVDNDADPTADPSAQNPNKDPKDELTGGVQYDLAYAEICRLIDGGDPQAAKAAIAALLTKMKGGDQTKEESLSDGQSETKMSALAESFKTLHNQFEALVQMVGPKLGVETSEIEKGV